MVYEIASRPDSVNKGEMDILAHRHWGIGIENEDFDLVRDAFVYALGEIEIPDGDDSDEDKGYSF